MTELGIFMQIREFMSPRKQEKVKYTLFEILHFTYFYTSVLKFCLIWVAQSR